MESACKKYWNGTMLSRVRYRRLSRLLALWIAVSGGVAAVAWTEDVAAAAVIAVSYDMPNGNGTATGGFFNYWDRDYTGNGSVAPFSAPHTNDGEALSGGLGDLTDGVIATQDWFFVGSAAGDGPYVGWQDIDPRITFHFASSVTIDTVTLHLADSTFSEVEPPNNANIDGTNFTIVNPVADVPFSVSFSGLGFTGSELTLELRQSGRWIFLSEVTFDDGITAHSISTPGQVLLLGMTIVGLGVWRRRRSAVLYPSQYLPSSTR
jgi:hypothetical protein